RPPPGRPRWPGVAPGPRARNAPEPSGTGGGHPPCSRRREARPLPAPRLGPPVPLADGVSDNAGLVEQGDLDELTRQVERLVSAADWDGLVDLHDRCRRALERGKQLWPVAAHAAYRLALQAPGRWAASALEST